ncbi:MAG: serine hydrolase domain-containing protein [Acidimicrobiales bacterium]
MHGGLQSQGDPGLSAELGALVHRRPRSIAAAVFAADAKADPALAFIRADSTTQFEIGSVTKGLTGMLLADCVERGEISLDTVVSDVISTSAGTEFGSISVRELCTHTSGLPRMVRSRRTGVRALGYVLLGADPYRGISASLLMKQAARQRLSRRGRHQYSNLGAAVLGQLLAIVVGSDYPSLVSERVLLPTRMQASAVATHGDHAPPGRSRRGLPKQPWVLDGYAPAGGVVSTIEDMARLASALLDGSAPGCESMSAIDGVSIGQPNRAIGMFWAISSAAGTDASIIWHNGGTGGYSALFALLPHTRQAVIVLGNAARPSEYERIAFGLLKWRVEASGHGPQQLSA